MAVREIVKYPHPVLKRRSEEVDRIDEDLKLLICDMVDTMYHASGVGLAACQVGDARRVVVLDVSPMDPDQDLLVIINPEIISEEGEIDYEEGCLSVPDCTEKVKRRTKVCVRGVSSEGGELEVTGEGILAIALQHEIDHLDGILILDRISRLKREIYRNRLKKERLKEGMD